jgi:methyl-accepting chemotaxis protein
VKALSDQVTVASRQQAQGISQVTMAVSDMEKVTQRTAAMAEQSAAAGEELNSHAEASMEVVRQLELMVGGREESSAGPRAAAPAPREVSRPAPKLRSVPAPRRESDATSHDTGTYGRF